MNLTTRQLRAFTAVARLGSFTRAAQQVHMTQAGLSGMIRELESQFGERLFDRTTRTVSLTATGTALLPVAEQVLEQLDAVAAAVGTIGATARRSLTVGTTPMMSSAVMPRVIREFAGAHPKVSLRIRDLDRSQIQGQVESGHLDAGFGVFLNSASGIHRAQIAKLPLQLAGPQSADLGTSVSWKALRKMALIGLSVDNPVQRVIDEQLEVIGRGDDDRLRFNNFNTLVAMVEAGSGFAVVPSFARASRYCVRFADLTSPRISLDFYLITKKGREVHPALPDFSRTLTKVLAGPHEEG
jgi:DNA-binding transcriptional LysR family regulator